MIPTIILFVVLAILWTYDLVQTMELTNRFGSRIEENPVTRFLLKHGRIDFIAFKVIDLVFLGFILRFILLDNILLASGLLFVFVLIYTLTVLHNYLVIKKYNF